MKNGREHKMENESCSKRYFPLFLCVAGEVRVI